jgi:tetratricopeptide (TPR) repeat protein
LAIDALERAQETDPEPSTAALLDYNLACYWSLAGKKNRALSSLARAFAIDPNYRDQVGDEPDFDPLRADPDFRELTSIIV